MVVSLYFGKTISSELKLSKLAVQFWPLYILSNEKNEVIANIWDGQNLKITFRELSHLIWRTCSMLSDDCDSIRQYASPKAFTLYNLYALWSVLKGSCQSTLPSFGKICIPPRVQIFLWLLSNNKLLARDNLAKRRQLKIWFASLAMIIYYSFMLWVLCDIYYMECSGNLTLQFWCWFRIGS